MLEDVTGDLLKQNTMLYTRNTENVSTPQLDFLKVLADGVTTDFSLKQIISHYQLSTSANVLKIKNHWFKRTDL